MQPNSYIPTPSFFDDVNPIAYQLWKKGPPLRRPSEHRIYESILFKRSKKTNFLKSRYFILFDDRLAYFKVSREPIVSFSLTFQSRVAENLRKQDIVF